VKIIRLQQPALFVIVSMKQEICFKFPHAIRESLMKIVLKNLVLMSLKSEN
jgi:hypothetical protein